MTGEKIMTIPNFSAGFSVIWGLWVMNPSFDMFATNPRFYAPMLSLVGSEVFWGALFFSCGVTAWILSYRGRRDLAAFVLFIVHAFFAALYFLGDPNLPGWALYGYISLVHFIFWRANRWPQRSQTA